MPHCHLIIGRDLPETLCHFVVRHLTELIAEVFRISPGVVSLRVDSAAPAYHFVGGRLIDRPAACLVTLYLPHDLFASPSTAAFGQLARRFLADTFGPPVSPGQIRILDIADHGSSASSAMNGAKALAIGPG